MLIAFPALRPEPKRVGLLYLIQPVVNSCVTNRSVDYRDFEVNGDFHDYPMDLAPEIFNCF